MGIPGLTTQLYSNPSLWCTDHDDDGPVAVVIDGDALMHFVVEKLRRSHFYSYWCFEQALKDMLVDDIGISRVKMVLFDGAIPVAKIPTCRERVKQRCKLAQKWFGDIQSGSGGLLDYGHAKGQHLILPFTKQLMFDVLTELGIAFEVCDEEADERVLECAAELSAAAMSKDSDCFLYDLPKGYIPLDRWEADRSSCRFRFKCLLKEYNLTAKQAFRLPCFMGNDETPRGHKGLYFKEALSAVRRGDKPEFTGVVYPRPVVHIEHHARAWIARGNYHCNLLNAEHSGVVLPTIMCENNDGCKAAWKLSEEIREHAYYLAMSSTRDALTSQTPASPATPQAPRANDTLAFPVVKEFYDPSGDMVVRPCLHARFSEWIRWASDGKHDDDYKNDDGDGEENGNDLSLDDCKEDGEEDGELGALDKLFVACLRELIVRPGSFFDDLTSRALIMAFKGGVKGLVRPKSRSQRADCELRVHPVQAFAQWQAMITSLQMLVHAGKCELNLRPLWDLESFFPIHCAMFQRQKFTLLNGNLCQKLEALSFDGLRVRQAPLKALPKSAKKKQKKAVGDKGLGGFGLLLDEDSEGDVSALDEKDEEPAGEDTGGPSSAGKTRKGKKQKQDDPDELDDIMSFINDLDAPEQKSKVRNSEGNIGKKKAKKKKKKKK